VPLLGRWVQVHEIVLWTAAGASEGCKLSHQGGAACRGGCHNLRCCCCCCCCCCCWPTHPREPPLPHIVQHTVRWMSTSSPPTLVHRSILFTTACKHHVFGGVRVKDHLQRAGCITCFAPIPDLMMGVLQHVRKWQLPVTVEPGWGPSAHIPARIAPALSRNHTPTASCTPGPAAALHAPTPICIHASPNHP